MKKILFKNKINHYFKISTCLFLFTFISCSDNPGTYAPTGEQVPQQTCQEKFPAICTSSSACTDACAPIPPPVIDPPPPPPPVITPPSPPPVPPVVQPPAPPVIIPPPAPVPAVTNPPTVCHQPLTPLKYATRLHSNFSLVHPYYKCDSGNGFPQAAIVKAKDWARPECICKAQEGSTRYSGLVKSQNPNLNYIVATVDESKIPYTAKYIDYVSFKIIYKNMSSAYINHKIIVGFYLPNEGVIIPSGNALSAHHNGYSTGRDLQRSIQFPQSRLKKQNGNFYDLRKMQLVLKLDKPLISSNDQFLVDYMDGTIKYHHSSCVVTPPPPPPPQCTTTPALTPYKGCNSSSCFRSSCTSRGGIYYSTPGLHVAAEPLNEFKQKQTFTFNLSSSFNTGSFAAVGLYERGGDEDLSWCQTQESSTVRLNGVLGHTSYDIADPNASCSSELHNYRYTAESIGTYNLRRSNNVLEVEHLLNARDYSRDTDGRIIHNFKHWHSHALSEVCLYRAYEITNCN